MKESEIYRTWPGLEHWSPIYHLFHYIGESKTLPSQFNVFFYFIILLYIFCVISLINFYDINKSMDPLTKTIVLFVHHFIYLEAIPSDYLAPAIMIYVLSNILFGLAIYKIPQLLERQSISFTIRFFIQFSSLYLLLVSNSLLQKSITAFLFDEHHWRCLVFSSIDIILLLIVSFFTIFFFSRPMSLRTLIVSSWDDKNFIFMIYTTCVLQQLWSFVYWRPKICSYIMFGLNFIFSIFFLFQSLNLFFYSSFINISLIFISSFGLVASIIAIIIWYDPTLIFYLMIALYLCLITDACFLSPWIYDLYSLHISKQLQVSNQKDEDQIDEMSENSDIEIGLPHLPPSQMIRLIRYLVSHNYPDVNELTIRIAETQTNASVIIECFRILHIQSCVPSAVWAKIIDIDKREVNFFDRSLLCDLQYEAIKHEINEPVFKNLCDDLDEIKKNIQRSLLTFVNGLQIESKKMIEEGHVDYGILCQMYEVKAKLYLKNAPRSIEIASNYEDYLMKLKGDFVSGHFWGQKVECLKSGHITNKITGHLSTPLISMSSASSLLSTSTTQNQELIYQEASEKIKSRALPIVPFALILVAIVMLFCIIFRPSKVMTFSESSHHSKISMYDPTTFAIAQMHLLRYAMPQFVDICAIISKYLNFTNIPTSSFDHYIYFPEDVRNKINTEAISYVSELVSETVYYKRAIDIKKVWAYDHASELLPFPLDYSTYLVKHFIDYSLQFADRILNGEYKNHSYAEQTLRDSIFNVILLSNDINISSNKFVNTSLMYLQSVHSDYTYNLIIWCIVTFILTIIFYLLLLYFLLFYPKKEFQKFFDVFAHIDPESLVEFQSSITTMINGSQSTASVKLELPIDDINSLALDEVELSEDNPISIPISLGFQKNIYEEINEEKTNLYGRNCVKNSIVFEIILISIFLIGMATAGIIHRYVNYYGNMIANDFATATYIVPVSLYTMRNALMYLAGIHSEKPTMKCQLREVAYFKRDIFEDYCIAFENNYTSWSGQIDDQFIYIVNLTFSITSLVIDQLPSIIDDAYTIFNMYKIGVIHGMYTILILVIVIFIATVFVHMQFTVILFDSLVCLLRLIPSRYFSTISSIIETFESSKKKTSLNSNKVKRVMMHSIDPVILINKNNVIIDAGQSALSLFEYMRNELNGHNIEVIIPSFNIHIRPKVRDSVEITESSIFTNSISLSQSSRNHHHHHQHHHHHSHQHQHHHHHHHHHLKRKADVYVAKSKENFADSQIYHTSDHKTPQITPQNQENDQNNDPYKLDEFILQDDELDEENIYDSKADRLRLNLNLNSAEYSDTATNGDGIKVFEAEAFTKRNNKILMRVMVIPTKTQTSMIILKDMSNLIDIKKQTQNAQLNLKVFLNRLMPNKFSKMYLNGQYTAVVTVPNATLASLGIENFSQFCLTHTHEEVFDCLDFFHGNIDRILSRFPAIARLGQDNGKFFYVSGITNPELGTKENSKIMFEFIQTCFQTIMEGKENLECSDWCELIAAIHVDGPVSGGISNRENPIFKEWSSFYPLMNDMMKDVPKRKVRISKKALRYLKDFIGDIENLEVDNVTMPSRTYLLALS
ncbi:hypothetical protein TRFO_27042 [Tritrichomonas foetus]|uniref:Guanylate cyclase domain-containing protein n=1 Tax=Tritrichomonas foetus TaxID=1144522 RepID=A0A1J4K377_9EUKA|nr:hypothetical protein TRFO_27042 [Tritrichomonas foetus]|eukprot:OHT05280.1 hypothetical protein TRFO_27042 [Tritrichomonas foetus]